MHIALFLPDLYGGGAQRVMLSLAKYFAAQGHRVDMVVARTEGALLLPLLSPTVRLVDLQSGLRSCWGLAGLAVSATLRLAAYLRREKPDALLSTLTGANLVAIIACRVIGRHTVRLIVREAVTLRNIRGFFRFRFHLMRWLYQKADIVVALTDFMRQELIKAFCLDPDRVVCIPNPVDLDFIREKASVSLEHPWFLSKKIPVVIGIGRLSPQKDFATLIRAFARVRSRYEAHLIILGEGPLRGELEALIKELKLDKDVILPGFDNNPYRWLNHANVFVLSSLWEGYPNVLLEALALGKQVIMTAYDPSAQQFAKTYCVTVIPTADSSAMAEAILKLLAIPSEHRDQVPLEVTNASKYYLEMLLRLSFKSTE